MYTATLTDKIFEGGMTRFIFSFSNGAITVTQEFTQRIGNTDVEALKRSVALVLNDLNNPKVITVGAFDPTPAAVVPPSQAQIDQDAWLTKYRKLAKAKVTLVDVGVITATQPTYLALLNDVKATIKPEYLDVI